ncbi:Fes1-domain-containing protein [Cubamyces sp. BRFM 1775]|nr:Fes1-domain-containing protein [Cubamyces sp. BRFM 1775]
MESLLRWSIANSDPRDANQPPPQPRSDLDPSIIDMILGKPDSELMKEALAVAVDESKDEDDRLQALDNFEMLIEQIDNANSEPFRSSLEDGICDTDGVCVDMEKLKMWEPLHALLTNSSSSEEIQRQVLWILGTAVQNNPAAQHSYLSLSPLSTLLSFLSPSSRSGKTRAKAVYALSGLLKHNAAAVNEMAHAGGWDILRDALEDSDISVRRKVAFLLNSLLVPTGTEEQEHAQEAARAQELAQTPANVQQPLQVPTSTQGVVAAATVPTSAVQQAASAPSQPSSQAQAVTIHPSSSALGPAAPPTSEPTTAAAALGTSGPALSPPQTVHPNSHASMVSDPRSISTSRATADALEQTGLLRTLVGALASPLPYGADGEHDTPDADFEEKVVRGLHTYATACGRAFPAQEGERLKGYLQEQEKKEGGEEKLAERWNLTREEVRELKKAAAEPAAA